MSILQYAGEEDVAKVLVNIKKRKERTKRKKNARGEEDEDKVCCFTLLMFDSLYRNASQGPSAKPPTGDAFEDVLYGSESELDDSDDEAPAGRSNFPSKRKDAEHGARLTHRRRRAYGSPSRCCVAYHKCVSVPCQIFFPSPLTVRYNQTRKSTRRRKPGQDAARFKTDEDTGKMIIDSDSDSDANAKDTGADVAGNAYRESITSVDGFTRGLNGRVKFNKDTKKRRREHDEAEDVEMADGDAASGKGRRSKRKSDVKLGHEFKAKVGDLRSVCQCKQSLIIHD